MTDRVQPGAIDSIIRTDELSQVFDQFSEGWIVETGTTPAARRRSNIDETALNSFTLVSTSGLDVTIDAGEAFVGGWCARDVQTTISLPPSATSTVVAGWSLDASFDPDVDANRDLADVTIVDLESRTDPEYPVTELFEVTTGSSSVTTTTDLRRLSPTATVDTVDVAEALELPVFPTEADIPSGLGEGTLVFVSDNQETLRVGSADTEPVGAKIALAGDFVL
jgi:hypothetical protein